MNGFADFLHRNPEISHSLLAILYTSLIIVVLNLIGIPPIYAYTFPAVMVSTFFYGREAGQLEHDFKRDGAATFNAWYRATLFFMWPLANIKQWLAPALSASLWAFLMYRLGIALFGSST